MIADERSDLLYTNIKYQFLVTHRIVLFYFNY